jgi:hypothetical protein
MKRLTINRLLAIVVLVASTATITGAIVAGAASTPTTIYACLKGGLLSKVGHTQPSCPSDARAISWGSTGPQGPQGPPGPALATCSTPPAPNLNFSDCVYDGTNFHYANFVRANLTGAILEGVVLNNANLTDANLTGDVFTQNPSGEGLIPAVSANFKGANLTAASFEYADLTGADFTGTNLTGVTWANTTCPDGTPSASDGGTCIGHLG